jgi:hypothetical protein
LKNKTEYFENELMRKEIYFGNNDLTMDLYSSYDLNKCKNDED